MSGNRAPERLKRPQRLYPSERHPFELDPADVPDVYASICKGTCLEPDFYDGACLVFSKLEEPEAGDYVGIWLHPDVVDPSELPRRVKRLVCGLMPGITLPYQPQPGDEVVPCLVFEEINPPKRYVIDAREIVAMHKMIGVAESMGDGTARMRRPA